MASFTRKHRISTSLYIILITFLIKARGAALVLHTGFQK